MSAAEGGTTEKTAVLVAAAEGKEWAADENDLAIDILGADCRGLENAIGAS